MLHDHLKSLLWQAAILLFALGTIPAVAAELKVLPPEEGVYHAAFPDFPNNATPTEISAMTKRFEDLSGKGIAWVVVANDWVDGIRFPTAKVNALHMTGKIPLIRMMPWSVIYRSGGRDDVYKLERIAGGYFDSQLRQWAREAKATRQAIMIEFGPEVNGSWFPWNGYWNGADDTFSYGDPSKPDGGERYVDAYRRVVDLFNAGGVKNVTWVFHVDAQPKPEAWWNAMEHYYPGDDYVDWIGVSVFGAQYPEDYYSDFGEVLSLEVWEEITALSETKPIALVETAVIEDLERPYRKAEWIQEAFSSIKNGTFDRLKAITWWHNSAWNYEHTNDMRIDSSDMSLQVYQDMIADPFFIADPVLSDPGVPSGDAEKCKCGIWRNRYGNGCSIVRPESSITGTNKFLSFTSSRIGCRTEQQCLRNYGTYLNSSYWCPQGWVLKDENN